jgi:hypothetical protein
MGWFVRAGLLGLDRGGRAGWPGRRWQAVDADGRAGMSACVGLLLLAVLFELVSQLCFSARLITRKSRLCLAGLVELDLRRAGLRACRAGRITQIAAVSAAAVDLGLLRLGLCRRGDANRCEG